ncbi:MAG: hypothetical protein QM692_02075 [Thermomicrobiales bacterium]
MQQTTRYYITKSGEEPTVRSVRIERPEMTATAVAEARRSQGAECAAETMEPRRSVKDLVQGAIHKRSFLS